MVVATDAQRQMRMLQLEQQKAYEAGRYADKAAAALSIEQLVRAGSAMKKREQKSGKQTVTLWEPTAALSRLFDCSSPEKRVLARERVKTFCDACDADRPLREMAQAQNLDPDALREMLEALDYDA